MKHRSHLRLAMLRPAPMLIAAGAAFILGNSPNTQAQAFSDAKRALVNYTKAELQPQMACRDLEQYRGKHVLSITAREIAADAGVPAHCRVTGLLDPEIAYEVSLPARWNGRFYMIGNGGHAGESLDDPGRAAQRHSALQHGFAFAQTNTGHDARQEPGATFVLSNPRKATDYAYRAVNLTARTTKDITAQYYARPVQHAYWNSCSNGGRQGLIEAQRYPTDFDGIAANAPWVDQTGFTIGAIWNQQAIDAAPLTAPKLELLAKAVLTKCDAVDGLEDGLIDDPRRCDFDAHRDVPACPAGTDAADCLTAAQADAIMKIYQGPRVGTQNIFPGFMLGSEAITATPFGGGGPFSAWMNTIVPQQPNGRAADFNLADNTMRYLVHRPPQPDWDYRTFDFARDPRLLRRWGKQANANSTNLDRFRKRGGKILMTYGWSDQILQPMMGVNYYEAVAARYGKRTPEFFRLFMVPGMAHCSGGTGPDRFDAVTALIDWVEGGKAPDTLIATQVKDNTVVRSRPLCTYPQVARYTGQGSIDDAANFTCVQP